MRHYITQHTPGTFLTFEQRMTLAADWNDLVRPGCRVTVRQFAARHGLRPETWRREYHRVYSRHQKDGESKQLLLEKPSGGLFPAEGNGTTSARGGAVFSISRG